MYREYFESFLKDDIQVITVCSSQDSSKIFTPGEGQLIFRLEEQVDDFLIASQCCGLQHTAIWTLINMLIGNAHMLHRILGICVFVPAVV